MNSLQEALRAWRHEHNLLQKQAADLLHISRGYYTQIERGHRLPSDKVLENISRQSGIKMIFVFPLGKSLHELPMTGKQRKNARKRK